MNANESQPPYSKSNCFTDGKHKGRSMFWVARYDPDYIYQLLTLDEWRKDPVLWCMLCEFAMGCLRVSKRLHELA